jgi:hypothetical protein
MRRWLVLAAVTLLAGLTQAADKVAVVGPSFEGAEGFGAMAKGGADGRTLRVTTLEDDPANVRPGSLRWAVAERGPRVVGFDVAGNIRLKAPLKVTEPFLTIDGRDAPGDGICICDHSLWCKNTHDVIVRHVRLRHGDVETLRMVEAARLERPKNSIDLDSVSLDDSKNLIFDHCSLSWCCDEAFGIVRCENVTIQWCLIAEPLANPKLHPYGDRHAFGLNTSANTLSMHHCLVAHYVMRGPQFEANDVRRAMGYDVRMEAVNNVLFDYERSGSRYTTGIEDHPEEAAGRQFQFQFINNYYLNPDNRKPEIEAVLKHGVTDQLQVYIAGNLGPHRPQDSVDELAGVATDTRDPIRSAPAEVRAQLVANRLFTPPVPVTIERAVDAYRRVLDQVGCNLHRDPVDERIITNVKSRRFGRIVKSQADVGGWPDLK